jgi:lysophospholipase L1-like esterase
LIKPFAKLKGIGLNGRAWRSTFLERHIPLPSQEPREGYWGSKMPKASYDPDIGPIAPETHIPGMVDVDRFGRQYAFSSPKPQGRLLILGASVAFGAYASSESQTYFHKLALRLGRMHHPAEIIVQATGGWTSVNELAAFKKLGIPLHPDYVIVLDGMNDMMLLRDRPEEQRVREYLEHMKQLRDIALAHGIKVVFSPQPFLPEKDVKSPLEVIIQSESYYPLRRLVGAWAQLRQGVNALAVPGKAFVVDCTDIYDNVQRTIFADIWHFSDFGQARLARYMAWKLDAILRGQAVPVGDIPPRSIPGF